MATTKKPAKKFKAQVQFKGEFFVPVKGTTLEEALANARERGALNIIEILDPDIEYLDGEVKLTGLHEVTY